MHITTEWHNDQFNINLHKKEGQDAFLSIKGCRVKEHEGKKFISFPSTKNVNTGKYWNHAWANDPFQQHVIGIALAAKPATRNETTKAIEEMSDDIPF